MSRSKHINETKKRTCFCLPKHHLQWYSFCLRVQVPQPPHTADSPNFHFLQVYACTLIYLFLGRGPIGASSSAYIHYPSSIPETLCRRKEKWGIHVMTKLIDVLKSNASIVECIVWYQQTTIGRGEGTIVFERMCHSPNIKSPEIVCISEITFWRWFDTILSFKGPESVYTRSFEMNWHQIYRGSIFCFICWMDERYAHTW
jgi:hypothetical protein